MSNKKINNNPIVLKEKFSSIKKNIDKSMFEKTKPINTLDNEGKCFIKKLSIDIGKYLNIPMWDALSSKEQIVVKNDSSDFAECEYYVLAFLKFNDLPLMNVIRNDYAYGLFTTGMKAEYTLNLNTYKPTRNSPIQKTLPNNVIETIKSSKVIKDILSYSSGNNFL